jgi:hypothetical protein
VKSLSETECEQLSHGMIEYKDNTQAMLEQHNQTKKMCDKIRAYGTVRLNVEAYALERAQA